MGGKSETLLSVDIEVPNQTRYLRLIGNLAEQIARDMDLANGDCDTLAYHLNLVLTEAVTNAIKHGSSGDPNNTVRICISIEDKNLCVRVYDHGQGFNLEDVPATEFADLGEHGRGVFFIRSLMDSVDYCKTEGGNVLEMRKKLA